MENVIVTVKRKGEAAVYDLQVPTNVKIVLLAEKIAQEKNWRDKNGRLIPFNVEAFPAGAEQGRMLDPQETLAEARIWDGGWLVFHPLENNCDEEVGVDATTEVMNAEGTDTDSPVKQWRKV